MLSHTLRVRVRAEDTGHMTFPAGFVRAGDPGGDQTDVLFAVQTLKRFSIGMKG